MVKDGLSTITCRECRTGPDLEDASKLYLTHQGSVHSNQHINEPVSETRLACSKALRTALFTNKSTSAEMQVESLEFLRVLLDSDPKDIIDKAHCDCGNKYSHQSLHASTHGYDCTACHWLKRRGRKSGGFCFSCDFGVHTFGCVSDDPETIEQRVMDV